MLLRLDWSEADERECGRGLDEVSWLFYSE